MSRLPRGFGAVEAVRGIDFQVKSGDIFGRRRRRTAAHVP